MNILDLIPTGMKKAGSTGGGEYAGPCPWCGGEDRFRVWPEEDGTGRYWCRQCDRKGDGIRFIMDYEGTAYHEAREKIGLPSERTYTKPVKVLEAPPKAWQDALWTFAEECEARLWSDEGSKALAYLRERGFSRQVIKRASFGFNPEKTFLDVPGFDRGVCIVRGITIPWVIDGELWKVNVRRAGGSPKYICATGSANGLFNADEIRPGSPIALVEGEFDAFSIVQKAHSVAWAVATGSTGGSRKAKWIARLMAAPVVLVAFDSDKPGEEAAKYWTETLPNAVRWRPYWGDANQMLVDGADLRAWIEAGIYQNARAAA